MPKYWVKVWVEILKDEKVGPLPDNLWRLMIECFLMAGQIDDNGRLPPLSEMSWIVHKSKETLTKELQILQETGKKKPEDQGIIEQKPDGTYFVTNWAKRQVAASPARRMREYRKRQASDSYELRYDPVTKASPRSTEVQNTTTTTAAGRLGDYVIKYLSRKGQVSSDTANLVKTLLETYAEADVIYAVDQTERKAASTNDPPTLEYIEAICARRQRGEPDQKESRNGQKRTNQSKRRTASPSAGTGDGGRIEADKPAGISLD